MRARIVEPVGTWARLPVTALLCTGLWFGVASVTLATAAAQDGPLSGSNVNPLSGIDLTTLTGFRDRPLFSPTRTRPPDPVPDSEPPAETVEAPVEQAASDLDIQLLGVIGTPEGTTALILDSSDDSRHALRHGAVFAGWTVSSIDEEALVFEKDGEIRRFPVFKPADPAPETLPEETEGNTGAAP